MPLPPSKRKLNRCVCTPLPPPKRKLDSTPFVCDQDHAQVCFLQVLGLFRSVKCFATLIYQLTSGTDYCVVYVYLFACVRNAMLVR